MTGYRKYILSAGLALLIITLIFGCILYRRFENLHQEPVKKTSGEFTSVDLSRFYDLYPSPESPENMNQILYQEADGLQFLQGWFPEHEVGIGRWMTSTESELQFENKCTEKGYIILELLSIEKEKTTQFAEVYLNGRYLGKREIFSHVHPFAFDTKGALKMGRNRLVIKTAFTQISSNPDDIRSLSIMLKSLEIYFPASTFSLTANRIDLDQNASLRYTIYLEGETRLKYSLARDYDFDIGISLYPPDDQSGPVFSKVMPADKGIHELFISRTGGIKPGTYRLKLDFYNKSEQQNSISLINPELLIQEKTEEKRERPMFFAFYYPWYIPDERELFTINPLYKEYHFSKNQLEWEIDTAKEYGIDGFCVEYFGISDRNAMERYKTIIETACEKDFKIIFFLDGITIYHRFLRDTFNSTIARNIPADPGIVEMKLLRKEASFISEAFASQGYYKRNLIPLVYLYAAGSTWDLENQPFSLMANLYSMLGINIAVSADIGASSPRSMYNIIPYLDSFTFYTAHNAEKLFHGPEYTTHDIFLALLDIYEKYYSLSHLAKQDKGLLPVVFSGYDDSLVHPQWTQPGVSNSLYIKSYETAIANNPEIIFIATWNECMEGNGILPSHEHGYRFLELHRNLLEQTVF